MDDRIEVLGAVVALLVYGSSITVFVARIAFEVSPGHWIGLPFLLTAFPLGYLLFRTGSNDRGVLYRVQVGLMLASVIVLFLLDYILTANWRDTPWIVIPLVTLYFAGLGGMIGVAARVGRNWMITAVILFFATAALAFLQRAITGI